MDIYNFPKLLKFIRAESWLNQEQFADKLWVSMAIIGMYECWSREPSKKIINKLADKLQISRFSLAPFITTEVMDIEDLSSIEQKIVNVWTKLQMKLIQKKIYLLKD